MTLVPLPALADNYIWMLQDGRSAIVKGPEDFGPKLEAPARGDLQLAAILVTRHPADPGRFEPQTTGADASAALRQRKNESK